MMPPRAQDFNLGSGNPRLASVKLRRISVAMILAGLMVLFGAAEEKLARRISVMPIQAERRHRWDYGRAVASVAPGEDQAAVKKLRYLRTTSRS